MAIQTLSLNPLADAPPYLLERHFRRKHGPDAYYGNPQARPARGRTGRLTTILTFSAC